MLDAHRQVAREYEKNFDTFNESSALKTYLNELKVRKTHVGVMWIGETPTVIRQNQTKAHMDGDE